MVALTVVDDIIRERGAKEFMTDVIFDGIRTAGADAYMVYGTDMLTSLGHYKD